jgi:hemerythrin-like domain-containing protein
MNRNRRDFITLGSLGALTLYGQVARGQEPKAEPKPDSKGAAAEEAGFTATEDLMREHGVLGRIMLVYEEGVRRLSSGSRISGDLFGEAAAMVRKFIEQYHEILEEKYIFPELASRQRHVELIRILREQHQAGRSLTNAILAYSAADRFATADGRAVVVRACEAFIRMYRPHRAREETVLFPALHEVLSFRELDHLGDVFEEQEVKLLGPRGFEKMVEQVAALEKQLDILELSQFTPRVGA